MGAVMHAATDERMKRPNLLLLWGGAGGPIVFTLVYTLDGLFLPGYDAIKRPTSDLSLGPNGWVQITNFLLLGILMLGLAFAVRSSRSPLSNSTWTSLLLGVFGVGLVIAGLFLTDPTPGYPPGVPLARLTFHGVVHQVGSLLAFGSLLAVCFVAARHLWHASVWHTWAMYSLLSGLLMMVSLAGFGLAMALGGPAGLLERYAGSFGLAWVALTAGRLALIQYRKP
jgi:hypothetical protein